MDWPKSIYQAHCRRCPRLVAHLRQVRTAHPAYFAAPVPPFGVQRPRLLIVGLAPGMHGANATGRPFTGDHAGILLYRTLHRFGFGSAPRSVSADDALRLVGCRITNAVKCLPPANKPTPAEIRSCNDYLRAELQQAVSVVVILALGRVAHEAILRALEVPLRTAPFGHGRVHALPDGRQLVDSYHCSRYNTQTGRLTEKMFQAVFQKISELMSITL